MLISWKLVALYSLLHPNKTVCQRFFQTDGSRRICDIKPNMVRDKSSNLRGLVRTPAGFASGRNESLQSVLSPHKLFMSRRRVGLRRPNVKFAFPPDLCSTCWALWQTCWYMKWSCITHVNTPGWVQNQPNQLPWQPSYIVSHLSISRILCSHLPQWHQGWVPFSFSSRRRSCHLPSLQVSSVVCAASQLDLLWPFVLRVRPWATSDITGNCWLMYRNCWVITGYGSFTDNNILYSPIMTLHVHFSFFSPLSSSPLLRSLLVPTTAVLLLLRLH